MITVLKVNKQGNRVVSYTCTDGTKSLDLSKEQLSQYITQKRVSNATQQVYKGTKIIRIKDTNKININKDSNKATCIKIEYLKENEKEYNKRVEIVINKLSINEIDKLKIMVQTFAGFLGSNIIKGKDNISNKVRKQKGIVVTQVYNGWDWSNRNHEYEYDLDKSEFIGHTRVDTCNYWGKQTIKIIISECNNKDNSIRIYKTDRYDKVEIHSNLVISYLLNNFGNTDLHCTRMINIRRDENKTLKVNELKQSLKNKIISSNYLQILGSNENVSFWASISSMADASESDLYC